MSIYWHKNRRSVSGWSDWNQGSNTRPFGQATLDGYATIDLLMIVFFIRLLALTWISKTALRLTIQTSLTKFVPCQRDSRSGMARTQRFHFCSLTQHVVIISQLHPNVLSQTPRWEMPSIRPTLMLSMSNFVMVYFLNGLHVILIFSSDNNYCEASSPSVRLVLLISEF